MDESLFRWINNWPDWLSPFFVFFSEATKNPIMRVLLILTFVAMLFTPKLRAPAIIAAACWPLANLLCDIFKNATEMLRPCVALDGVNLHVSRLTSFGMPSAHSANMACVATAFGAYSRRWGLAWGIVAFLTGLSRMYVGVHFPSQVVCGWLLGAAVAMLGVFVTKRFIQKPEINEELAEAP